jgi:hypothetical protein
MFAAYCLFGRILPIDTAGESRNGNLFFILFFKMTAGFKNKRASIITARKQYLTFAMFPVPLNFSLVTTFTVQYMYSSIGLI